MIDTRDFTPWPTWPSRPERRHRRGSAPCKRCQDGNHPKCRPRLDNTLCTCECPTAEGWRVEAAELPPHLTEQEKVQELARLGIIPPLRRREKVFPRIDRQQLAETDVDIHI